MEAVTAPTFPAPTPPTPPAPTPHTSPDPTLATAPTPTPAQYTVGSHRGGRLMEVKQSWRHLKEENMNMIWDGYIK